MELSRQHPALFRWQRDPGEEARADAVQLFVFPKQFSRKCVIVRPKLVHMVRLYFSRVFFGDANEV